MIAKKTVFRTLFVLTGALLMTACGGASQKQIEQGEQLIEATHKAKDYQRMLALADSLEQAGSITPAKANYWRGYAFDRMKQADNARDCWRLSMEQAEDAGKGEMDIYVKSASRLANLLSVSGDTDGTLDMALPAVAKIEEMGCDTTSDYVNLLIYIGCCQATKGGQIEEAEHGFFRAYHKHLENIERKHTDAAYKDAIAGLINIAYYSVKTKNYREALYYTRYFGELLGEYEQRPDINADYVDRQLGRYDIYKAKALAGLGQRKEADEVFEAFRATRFSQTPEGQAMAREYQQDCND